MRRAIIFLAVIGVLHLKISAQSPVKASLKKDTSAHHKPVKPQPIKGKADRRRLQQQQIKKHQKSLKEVDSVQKKLNKELRKNTDTTN